MIVVNSRAGQRSNRLVTIAYAMASAIERDETLRLTAFETLAKDYACSVSWNGRVVIRDSRFWEVVRLAVAAIRRLGWKSFLGGHVVSDWGFRDRRSLEKHADAIRAFFTPRRTFPALPRHEDEFVVGVHKRRGDYREFLGGRYYYEDEVYERCEERLRSLLATTGRKARFVEFPQNDAVQDQWTMSRCDCLMGPPSTFSAWASFMGRVPLVLIWNRDYQIRSDDIKYRGLYV